MKLFPIAIPLCPTHQSWGSSPILSKESIRYAADCDSLRVMRIMFMCVCVSVYSVHASWSPQALLSNDQFIFFSILVLSIVRWIKARFGLYKSSTRLIYILPPGRPGNLQSLQVAVSAATKVGIYFTVTHLLSHSLSPPLLSCMILCCIIFKLATARPMHQAFQIQWISPTPSTALPLQPSHLFRPTMLPVPIHPNCTCEISCRCVCVCVCVC